jgi:succinate-semialdehyde dehydrogenase/glutarate-semialdehyde dehydrogenase
MTEKTPIEAAAFGAEAQGYSPRVETPREPERRASGPDSDEGPAESMVNEGGPASGVAKTVRTIPVHAPLTGELLGEVPIHGPDEVRAVVARAREAQRAWAALTSAERASRLLDFRDALVDQAEELVELMARESGKPRQEAVLHELAIVADLATYFARVAGPALAPRRLASHFFPYIKTEVQYVPRGVVAVIGPWNFPLQLTLRDALAALAAGNAVVVKPSEVTPLITLKSKELWDRAGLPEDLFGVVTGDGSTGAALIDARPDLVVFTGSVATGKRVAAACGERLIPSIMELGGKAPLIACADCDVERTAQAIVVGGFSNSGQVCISVERVYAHTDIYDALVARVAELAGKLRFADPAQEHADIGAITFPKQLEVAERLIADALANGAELRAGGKRIAGWPNAFEPTVLADCDHRCAVMTEEIFGPVVPFMRVSSAEEAVRLANESHLGLNAFGRVLGEDGLRAMCQTKTICSERFKMPRRHPLAFPYSERTYGVLLKALRTMYRRGGALERLRRIW